MADKSSFQIGLCLTLNLLPTIEIIGLLMHESNEMDINSIPPLLLHEDAFYEYFLPYSHPAARGNIWGDLGLDTFGKDWQLVQSLDENYVWTVLDGDDQNQWIATGIHYVNRICYLVTEKPHHGLFMDFRIPRRLRSLTPIGLSRQMRKIEKTMAMIQSSTQ